MSSVMWTIALGLLLAMAPSATGGELISLKDGTSYVGEVTEVTDTHITVDVEFPVPGSQRISREKLSDRTLWRVLSARLYPVDSKAWMTLARWAEEHGLLVQALLAYRKAALDGGLAKEAQQRIVSVETSVAQDLFDRGEEYYVAERPSAARQYFEILVSRYPSTPFAPIAKTRLDQIEGQLAEAKAAAKEAAAAAGAADVLRMAHHAWDAEVEAIRAHLREGSKVRPAHFDLSQPVRTSRAMERATRHLESAWRQVQSLGAPPNDVSPAVVAELVEAVRSRLVRSYLDTGLAYLLRPSINQAEEYCAKACDLDPENLAGHDLHEKVIYARLTSGWWGGRFRSARHR